MNMIVILMQSINTWKIARIIAKSRFNEAHSIKIKTVS